MSYRGCERNSMFDLEQAIVAWREQLRTAGIKDPTTLEELESHLRETVKDLQRGGQDDQRALTMAIQKIGRPGMLNREFKKSSALSRAGEMLMIFIASLFVLLILFLGTCTVFMCYDTVTDRLMAATAMICVLAVAFGWKYAVPVLPVIASTRNRLLAGLGCVAGGFGVATFLCNVILPHFEIPGSHHLPAIGLWVPFFVVVCSTLGVGLAMSEADRERAGMKKSLSDASDPKVT
jgi:hypothetical protein